MSESYCLTVKDVYGAPLSDLRAPEGWEFTGEFRPPLRGERFLRIDFVGAIDTSDDYESNHPRLLLKKAPTVEDIYGEPLHMLTPNDGYEFTGEFRVPVKGDTWLNRYPAGRYSPSKWATPVDSEDGPRLILKKAPTVESVYRGQSMEQLKRNAEKIAGFKWTGVFRKVKDGDYILGATGGNSVVPVVNRPDLIGKWRVIMEKLPTIKEIYGKELADLRAPDGWRFTGEFRPGKSGEYVLGNRIFAEGYLAVPMDRVTTGMDVEARLILEKLPATPTIREVYGTDEPEIPVGWRVKEFRQVGREEEVSYLGAGITTPALKLVYGSVNYLYQRGFRLVLEKDPNDPRLLRAMSCTLTPTDVYGPVLPPIPAGYRVVGFRPPVKGEVYISPNLGKMVDALFEKGYPPFLILAPR